MQKTLEQIKAYHAFSYFAWNETTHKPLKWQVQKPFSPVCMLLVQIASMNVFYSMSLLEDNTFYEKLTLLWDFF